MKEEKTVLFLPFLKISSGHHLAAAAIIDYLTQKNPKISCHKVDILSYSYGKIEALVSTIYLKWIHMFPNIYNLIYQLSVYRNINENKRYRLYEGLFLTFMKKLIKEVKPELIICTHALPSYMLSFLKKHGKLTTPVVNVYTDFFIHRFWGVSHIDYHFVPTPFAVELLLKKGVPKNRIFQTGIPVHSKIKKLDRMNEYVQGSSYSILVSGGNLGVGTIEDLLLKTNVDNKFHYFILCGKNEKLYKKLVKTNRPNITPLKYISCREEMNELYNKVDAIITKPGGVTVSEALLKMKPIFIYNALPGQERINVEQLNRLGVIIELNPSLMVEEQLSAFFNNKERFETYKKKIFEYHNNFYKKEPYVIIEELLNKEV